MVLAEVHRPIPAATFIAVLDAVRNKILDLALELERVAPLAGQADAPPEQEAPAAAVINNHFHGASNVSIGGVGTSQVVAALPSAGDTNALLRYLGGAGMSPERLQELERVLEEDQASHTNDEPAASRRWTKTRAWLSRATTDTTTGALGGFITAAATAFLGGI